MALRKEEDSNLTYLLLKKMFSGQAKAGKWRTDIKMERKISLRFRIKKLSQN
jgi:hypothetical protein